MTTNGSPSALGWTPSRNFALAVFDGPGIAISNGLGLVPGPPKIRGLELTLKNAANSQNWSFDHDANGWAWHWAHSSLTPSTTRAVVAANSSGLPSLARKYAKLLAIEVWLLSELINCFSNSLS